MIASSDEFTTDTIIAPVRKSGISISVGRMSTRAIPHDRQRVADRANALIDADSATSGTRAANSGQLKRAAAIGAHA